jgi:hypothetical protein
MIARRRSLVAVALLSGLHAACICGASEPYHGDYEDLDPPRSLEGIDFIESAKGDPRILGCSDGQREGFAEVEAHPRIAGCVGAWDGARSLRDEPTGKPCGDDADLCGAPADVCAEGWHVCGVDGLNTDLRSHTTWQACQESAGPGKFVAAMSHGQEQELCPPAPNAATEFPCFKEGFCAEPVCCGEDCSFGKCRDAVWPGRTKISLGKAEGCGGVTSERNGGVVCCYDGEANPRDNVVEERDDAPLADPPGAPAAGEPKAGEPKAGEPKAAGPKAAEPKPASEGEAAD